MTSAACCKKPVRRMKSRAANESAVYQVFVFNLHYKTKKILLILRKLKKLLACLAFVDSSAKGTGL
ncbi:MAG: hypothetical protein RL189_1522 [Pseudomonadota bacterium]